MKNKISITLLVFLQSLANILLGQDSTKIAFSYTGADQIWIVPAGVYQITVKAWGAGGAGGDYVFDDIGGGGGFVQGILNVTPGEQLTIIVGGGGETGAGIGAYGGGGGKACGVGGRGGGRSALANSVEELITAGAGGGGGGVGLDYAIGGHAGGGLTAQPDNWLPFGGGAGTQTNGGDGGHNDHSPDVGRGEAGSKFSGGYANCFDNGYNGSGGGGYYGGGSGTDYGDGAGGGGSSYVPAGGNTIPGENNVPGNTADADYADSAGYGGNKAGNGHPGMLVITWTLYTFFKDGDSDGYGDGGNTIQSTSPVAGYVTDSTDCNDSNASVNPSVAEITGDSIDNNCNGIIDEINVSGNLGNQSWEDPSFWQNAGLNGVPDSTSIIHITHSASGNLTIGSDAEMRSLIIDSASSTSVSFGSNTITVSGGELSVPKKGKADASQATVRLKGDVKLNIADTIGNLKIAAGPTDTSTITLQQDVLINNDLVLTAPVINIKGSKKIEAQRDLVSSSEVKGSSKISLTGSDSSIVSAPSEKSQGKLDINKSAGAKVRPVTDLKAEAINISSGKLQLSDQTITAAVSNEGGTISGKGTVKGDVDAVKKTTDSGPQRKISPGNSPGLITIEGNLNLDSTELDFELFGTSPGTGYDQLKVTGNINIGNNVTLSLTADSIPAFEFVILDNEGTNPVQGRFEGLSNNGDTVTISSFLFRIYYNGGDGNDIALKMNDPVPVIDHCPADTTICQLNSVEYEVTTNTIPTPTFTYSFSGATNVEAGTPGTGSGSILNVGTTNVVLTATNTYGSASCSFNVEVTNVNWYADADGDGFGNRNNHIVNCTKPEGYVTDSSDCDDTKILYADNDGDGFGAGVYIACGIDNNLDCNDNDAAIHPGAPELCDGKDNNCNGQVDEGITYYRDADGDGYGNITKPRLSCLKPAGFVNNSMDCNDNNAAIHPGAVELCNGKDDNCDGRIDEGCPLISVSAQSASVTEGNKGSINMTFTVKLSAPAVTASQVSYQTVSGTATPNVDYVPKSGALSFAKGQSSKTVVVKIIGDKTVEANETFSFLLSNPVNLTIYQNNATGTIINDDGIAIAQNESSIKQQEKSLSNNTDLIIPNLLRRSQVWHIPQLPASNRIIVYNMNGRVAFNANNYKDNASFSTMATGIYFYEIIIREKDNQLKIYRGKLVITE